MTTSPQTFDLAGPLPDRLTVLEASAGTGKTYALAALATRFVAERGVTASQLCIVSFTEAATAELRGRLRDRLAGAAGHLQGPANATGDPLLDLLAAADPDQRRLRRERLLRAVAEFDAATITTIHGFCSRVTAGSAPVLSSPISTDDSDVVEAVTDAFMAEFGAVTDPPITRQRLLDAVRLGLQIPDARMARVVLGEITARQKAHADGWRRRQEQVEQVADLAERLVQQVRAQRVRDRRRTFDGMLDEARAVLQGPQRDAVVASLRERFGVVLIDEFQDTDRVQWDIFRSAFVDGERPVPTVLVGDPKQSIYRFRGAELSAYLAARDHAVGHGGTLAELVVNWRSDAGLLAGLDSLFSGFTFGADAVAFRPVLPAEPDGVAGLAGSTAPVQLRVLPDDDRSVPELRAIVLHDLVAEVRRTLDEERIVLDDGGDRAVRPSDIGILVRSNADATLYADALNAAGVAAASSSADNVATSEAARQWAVLLAALERPAHAGRVRAAALGWFVGWSAEELDGVGDEKLTALIGQLRAWAAELGEGGVAALLGEVRSSGVAKRVLSRPGGERNLTDLEHVGELLQVVTGGQPTGATELLGLLSSLGADEPSGLEGETLARERLTRRMDRDDATVKVLTVHMAKGLEFPIVLCPTLWTQVPGVRGARHAHVDGCRQIDTSSLLDGTTNRAEFCVVADADADERAGEDRRVLYVALTRAQHRLVVWWSPATKGNKLKAAPLGRLLLHAGGVWGGADPIDDGAGLAVDVGEVVRRGQGTIAAVTVADPGVASPAPRHDGDVAVDRLEVATTTRTLDRRWRTWSFTAVQGAAATAAALGSAVPLPASASSDGPPEVGGNDEGSGGSDAGGVAADDLPAAAAGPTLPLLGLAGGKAFGTLVHAVLEDVDLAAADLDDELRRICAERLAYRPLGRVLDPDELSHGLGVALRAPLGGPMGERPLAGLARSDRLDELAFDLPLAGFDAAAIGVVLADHLPDDDPFRPWAERAAGGGLAVDVAGWLTGSIDLVARCAPGGPYWLADYKTNRLPEGSDYGPDDLVDAMVHSGYPLQATLYLVALHRYLRWRLTPARYRPEHDLAGSAYLFLRGMDPARPGDDARGVLWWRPPIAALDALDHLFAGGGAP